MNLQLYNSLTRKKEEFQPLNPPFVGMYVCGPTVYGDPHLGHARSAINFDIVFRYLKHLDYKVRYVRNITDVGHLENDADEGEDKIAKKARLEQIEPMEVTQYYSNRYRDFMQMLNVLPPSIEPQASGHIIEQIQLVQEILDAGLAYVSNGSVYFDVVKYNQSNNYGTLSGRNIDELLSHTRENLEGQDEKQHSVDFALWKKASPDHIMKWNSPWSLGFPGWHLECTAMGTKYLGEQFDIHGGGIDLMFPHHESEIAQGCVAHKKIPAKYWLHNNMITLNGQKMGKSLGNAIALGQFFTGEHPLLEQAYSPMVIRFFMLQAHYRSTLDFSNEALQAAEKGLQRIFEAASYVQNTECKVEANLVPAQVPENKNNLSQSATIYHNIIQALNDDFNTPIAIAYIFDAVKKVNQAKNGKMILTDDEKVEIHEIFNVIVPEVLGLTYSAESENKELTDSVIRLVLELRQDAKNEKNWTISDAIRNQLTELGVTIKDGKDGTEFSY
jgi:cysteinyl-tRNA synthetase